MRPILLAGVALAALACAQPALADQHEQLQELVVSGEGQGTSDPSLTAPSIDTRRRELGRIPGNVALVDANDYKRTTPALTIKDALDYTPGVFAQPKWGDDTRLSIRGSGLSRNFHLRGVQLYMDGIPINTADGYGDFQEIDPSAYRMIEVYKGANALRFGANALGGAINFITATGRDVDASVAQGALDVGSFGFRRGQASSGGVHGQADWFVTGSWQKSDGFRDHSEGEAKRFSGNVGWRFSDDVETRFYLNANDVDQRIPGAVTRSQALNNPKAAAPGNLALDQQRNIDTVRFANRTTARLSENTKVEIGGFVVDRHLRHPIFQWLDYKYEDYGAFGRVTDERELFGRANRFVAGITVHNGETDARQFVNVGGNKGAPTSAATQKSQNLTLYAENTHYILPGVGVVTAINYLDAERKQRGRLNTGSGEKDFQLASPKFGLLWDFAPGMTAFANISRSIEAPSYGENNFAGPALAKAQKAWTGEIGARGRSEDFVWDVALYRAEIRDELFCSAIAGSGTCQVVNLDRTVHQGVEVGGGAALLKGLLAKGETPDKLWLNLAYTLNDFAFDKDRLYGKNELPGAPRHYLRGELLYKHPSGFYAGPNVEWVPQAYFVDAANTRKTKPYGLLGLKAGYDAGGQVSAYVEARNLTDKRYVASVSVTNNAGGIDRALYEPGSGRALYAGVKLRW